MPPSSPKTKAAAHQAHAQQKDSTNFPCAIPCSLGSAGGCLPDADKTSVV
jgi:hypothetical protein